MKVNSVKKNSYSKLFFSFVVSISIVVFTLTGCERNNTRKKINAFLEEHKVEQFNKNTDSWEKAKIKGNKINNQLYMILKGDESKGHRLFGDLHEERFSVEYDVWARNQPVYSRDDEYRYRCDLRLSQFAGLIVETGCYEAVKKLISYLNSKPNPSSSHWELILWVIMKIELVHEKNDDALDILNQFYSNNYPILGYINIDRNFLKFYMDSQNQNGIDIFYPEETLNIHREGTLEHAIKTSSKELQSALFLNYTIRDSDIQKNIPLQQLNSSLENFKPSNPRKGGYIFVFDNKKHMENVSNTSGSSALEQRSRNAYIQTTGRFSSQYFTRYETEIMHPVANPDNAQIIIMETYSYQEDVGWSTPLYLRHTNVQVVNLTTGKTIFNKTYRTPPREGNMRLLYLDNPYRDMYDGYRPELFAEQISEIVKRTL